MTYDATTDWTAVGEAELPEVIALRRAIHADPEIGLHCPRTAEKIKAALAGLPLEIREGTSTTGFVASGDRASALVQWLRLPVAERRIGDGLDPAMVEVLQKAAAGKNENYAIAAALAARLGLERVYPADDHSADTVTATLGDDFGKAIQAVWSKPNGFRDDYKRREEAVDGPDGRIQILDGVGLAVRQGDSLAIVGASGSGKTTLLGLLAGLDLPSGGEVTLAGAANAIDAGPAEKVRTRYCTPLMVVFA